MFSPGYELRVCTDFELIGLIWRFLSCTAFIHDVSGSGSRHSRRILQSVLVTISTYLPFSAEKTAWNSLALLDIGWRDLEDLDDFFLYVGLQYDLNYYILMFFSDLMGSGASFLVGNPRWGRRSNNNGSHNWGAIIFSPAALAPRSDQQKFFCLSRYINNETVLQMSVCFVRDGFDTDFGTNRF